MISKYEDFITESRLIQLLNESKVIFSGKFNNILLRMRDNKLASELLKISGNDYDVRYNFVDLTDKKDSVSFIPDAKAQELRGSKIETYKVTNNGRYLTHSDRNNRIFELLGYDKEGRQNWSPDVGTIGIILKEAQSPVSTNRYALFQEYVEENPKLAVINVQALQPFEVEPKEVWSQSRNNMKVGRLVRAILQSATVEFTDKDIEEFTNRFKATYDFAMDALKQFDIVKGSDIAHWYDGENYVSGGGTLNNSCMADMPSGTFDIYTKNSDVSLVILYSDDGQLKDDKYTSEKIKGRALLWTCIIQGVEGTQKFMDRIYTKDDSDVELFKQFAEKNGWWWKSDQNMEPWDDITNGSVRKAKRIIVEADEIIFRNYPYMDTMCYLNTDDFIITNDEDYDGLDRRCRDTGGDYDSM